MQKMVLILIYIFSINIAFGDNQPNVVFLKAGQVSPYQGYLFSEKQEQSFRLTDTKLDYQTQINAELTAVNLNYQDEVKVMNERITNQQAEIKELNSKVNPFFGKEFYFVLGAVLTGLVGFSVYRSSK